MIKFIPLFICFLAACSPKSELDPIFENACYGGNFSKHLYGKSPSYSAALDLEVEEWSSLTNSLKEFASQHELEFFDNGRISKQLKMLSTSVCSNSGIFIYASKRIWKIGDGTEHDPLPLLVQMTVYKNNKNADLIRENLNTLLQETWGEKVDLNHGISSTFNDSLL